MEEENTVIEAEETQVDESTETTEQIEDSEPSEEVETPAEPAADPEKKEKGIQKRFDALTREKYEARAEAEYWRKVATGEIAPPKQEPIQQAIDDGLPNKPTADQFDTYEEFIEAVYDWKENVKQAREQQKEVVAKRQTVAEQNAARIEAAKGRYEDFDEVVLNLNGIMVPQVTIEAMQESEVSADLFYYLGKNPEEAKRLQTLSIPAQLREIGKLEAKLEKPNQPVKRVSQAPTPINPVTTKGESVTKDPEKMSDEEWIKHERARVAKLGRRY